MPDKPIAVKWYHKPAIVIVALLTVGPFALPFVWGSPSFTKPAKIVITVLVVGLTIWLAKMSMDVYQLFMKEMQSLRDLKVF